jgi:hypothetical protein
MQIVKCGSRVKSIAYGRKAPVGCSGPTPVRSHGPTPVEHPEGDRFNRAGGAGKGGALG